MAIVTLEELKAQLNFTDGLGTADDALMTAKIAAAQDHIERLLGYKIEEVYPGAPDDPVPASLSQAVLMLAAHWYENREAVIVGVTAMPMPLGVREIVREYREWSF